MMSLDISDSSQIYAAFVVYLDLLEGNSVNIYFFFLPLGAVKVCPLSYKVFGVIFET